MVKWASQAPTNRKHLIICPGAVSFQEKDKDDNDDWLKTNEDDDRYLPRKNMEYD